MKYKCENCVFFSKNKCEKLKKNTYNDCKTFRATQPEDKKKEWSSLVVSGEDNARAVKLRSEIDFFEYGIK